ncbi:MAG: hypothetical protein QOF76_3552 [Solirubrobacteraceae bacterium]|jgi:hypothetical protein|nr:hypothetical protein [Solirubrobacteraceae bacterium]
MQIRRTRVQIHTDRLTITGTLQLPGEGYRSRVTDYLNTHDSGFIALIDAEVSMLDGSPTETHEFLAVGARHIVAMTETEDLGMIEEQSGSPGLADYRSPSVPPPSAG